MRPVSHLEVTARPAQHVPIRLHLQELCGVIELAHGQGAVPGEGGDVGDAYKCRTKSMRSCNTRATKIPSACAT